ncbi:MAG: ATP-binding protein [Chryseolinea sp.]
MNARVIIGLFMCACSFRAHGQLQASFYSIQHYTPTNGLNSTQTRGIIQDSLGYVWIANIIGLNRYDGYNFKSYPLDAAKKAYRGGIKYLLLDRKKSIWAVSDMLSHYSAATDELVHHSPDVNLEEVYRYCFDRDNRTIWMGTDGNGLFSYDQKSKEVKHFGKTDPQPKADNGTYSVWGISDRDTSLLIATRNGIWMVDKSTGQYLRPQCRPMDSARLFQTGFLNIIENSDLNRDLWLVSEKGLTKTSPSLDSVEYIPYPPGFEIIEFQQSENGKLWIRSAANELYWFDTSQHTYTKVDLSLGVDHFVVERDWFFDHEENLWSGSEASGVFKLTPRRLYFYHFPFPERVQWSVGAMFKHKDVEKLYVANTTKFGLPGEYWVAALNQTQPQRTEVHALKTKVKIHGITMSVVADESALWNCTFDQGVFRIPFDETGIPDVDKVTLVPSDPNNPHTISNAMNAFVYRDNGTNLWIVSRGNGLTRLDLSASYGQKGAVTTYRHNESDTNSLSHDYSLRIFPHKDQSLWIVTWSGLDLFQNGSFKHVLKEAETPRSVLTLHDGSIAIGTHGAMYNAASNGDSYRLERNALFDGYRIDDVLEDGLGRLWVTEPFSNRMFCYDRTDSSVVRFDETDGLPAGMTRLLKTSGGAMIVTSIQGITMFVPDSFEIKQSGRIPVLTNLQVNNEPVVSGATQHRSNAFTIPSHISEMNEVTFDHRHNNFTIEFSSMDMTAPSKNLYRHILEGFDKSWIMTDATNRTASYTNLDAGTYYFKVRASNHLGIWNGHERVLRVRILPPPWQTWWAYLSYSLGIISILIAFRSYDNRRSRLKMRAEYLVELDELRTRFYTNISHEFRTPLTLILGPLKEIMDGTFSGDIRQIFDMMHRNGQRLLQLINQLLDLNKLEAGKMKLSIVPLRLHDLLKDIAANYEAVALTKAISFSFQSDACDIVIYADREKIEKVVYNLLSNAFKFTHEGHVILSLKAIGQWAVVSVEDSGVGIPTSEIEKVFDRFFQVDSSQTRNYEGSGLGMALSKEFVDLHQGKIEVESKVGEGTTFKVMLLLGTEHLNADDQIKPDEEKLSSSPLIEIVNTSRSEMPGVVAGRTSIMIVEDNVDMREFMNRILSPFYHVVETTNGKQGLDQAIRIIPDLIISDILMPVMNGYQFCEAIKSNNLTCHVPVILLTAKADQASKLAGYTAGADAYIPKPFDTAELRLIVRNQLEHRRLMQDRFSRELKLEPTHIELTSFDEKFLTKVLTFIENQISNERLSIDQLSREVGYSNMHFYRKVKALTGQTPSQFVRAIRLKRAAQMLKAKSDNVTQIAYAVGFSSPPHFIKCFKNEFGVTPGQFAERHDLA